jgi:pimeloyl-ACP methyl ester carboxylesterase
VGDFMDAPIILIHGLFGALSDPGILAAFGDARVFAPDMLGYGQARHLGGSEPTLEDQADHVAGFVRENVRENVFGAAHIVGHSVGGAVAVMFASKYPELTKSLTSIEGNFTLADAFWSKSISEMSISQVEAIVQGYKSDVAKWIGKSIPHPTPWALSVARDLLNHQPASTVRAQARAAVAATSKPDYLERVGAILDKGIPLHLIAGERARKGWSVPDWVVRRAGGMTEIAGTGHLMMLEAPDAFATAIMRNVQTKMPRV